MHENSLYSYLLPAKRGEDIVFKQESELLKAYQNVEEVTFFNQPGVKGGMQFLLSGWNVFAANKLKKHIDRYKPDIIHIHNLHFAIGPIAIRTAHKAGIPVIITLHNYRLLCPSGILFFENKLFTESIDKKFPWSAVKKGVYRTSVLQTFWLAFTLWFHRKMGTWNMVSKYIVLTEFAKMQFVKSTLGVAKSKFVVKSNFVNEPLLTYQPRQNNFLFVGRLAEDKGLRVLLEAFKQTNHYLTVAGAGPLEQEVKAACKENPRLKYIGRLSEKDVKTEMQKCTALVFPSIWYEGMPMTILEAFSIATPVIASNLGAMASMIKPGYNGLLFEPNNVESLILMLNTWDNMGSDDKHVIQQNALSTYARYYGPEHSLNELQDIYKNTLATHQD